MLVKLTPGPSLCRSRERYWGIGSEMRTWTKGRSDLSFGENKHFIKIGQWFSTLFSLQHTNFEKKFGGTLKGKKRTKKIKIWLFLHPFVNIFRFGGTPRKFDGTLMRRGTSVEKHWNREPWLLLLCYSKWCYQKKFSGTIKCFILYNSCYVTVLSQ